jgi:ABC-type transport system substrate-binding protein
MKMLFRFLSVAILLSLVLSACATTAPSTPPAAGGTIVIRAGTGDGGDGLTPHQQIIQNFEDQNPNVSLSPGGITMRACLPSWQPRPLRISCRLGMMQYLLL